MEIQTFIEKLRRINPGLVYLLDPVMGEMSRGFYVDKECLPIYRHLVGKATIICPNQFEAEQLSGIKIDSIDSLRGALTKLHQLGAPNVIITSVDLPSGHRIASTQEDDMILVGSSIHSNPWFISFKEFKGYYVGVGDLFAALLLGRYKPDMIVSTTEGASADTPLSVAVAKAIAGVQGVLRNTAAAIEKAPPIPAEITDPAQLRVEQMRRRELRLIQSRQEIEEPSDRYTAQWL